MTMLIVLTSTTRSHKRVFTESSERNSFSARWPHTHRPCCKFDLWVRHVLLLNHGVATHLPSSKSRGLSRANNILPSVYSNYLYKIVELKSIIQNEGMIYIYRDMQRGPKTGTLYFVRFNLINYW